MARVESQKVRQALLVVGQTMETSPPPERLELYTPEGLPLDVAKDRSRARWRGSWVSDPEIPYEQNDFVLDDDNLWILGDIELIEEGLPPSTSTSGAWVLMTVGGGLRWAGEWDADVDYKENSVISYNNALYVATGLLDDGEIPGEVVELTTTTVKAGDAMFGGHNQPARILIKGYLMDPVPGPLGGEVNIGEGIGGTFWKLPVVPGDEVTLAWEGGTIHLFDGQHGDQLFFDPSPLDEFISDSLSPLTFTVPAGTGAGETTGGSGLTYVTVEMNPAVDTFEWVDPEGGTATWELMIDGSVGGGGGGSSSEFVDTLPSSPTDGDVVYFQNAAMEALGIVWTFRYRDASSSDHKWEYVGGAPLHIYEATQYNSTSSSFVAMGSQTIVAPLDGEYETFLSAAIGLDNSGANKYTHMGVGVNGSVDAGASMRRAGSATEAYGVDGRMLMPKPLDVNAGDVIRPMFKQEGSVLAYIEQAKLTLRPIRVG